MYEIPDNYTLFEFHEREQERVSRLNKRYQLELEMSEQEVEEEEHGYTI